MTAIQIKVLAEIIAEELTKLIDKEGVVNESNKGTSRQDV